MNTRFMGYPQLRPAALAACSTLWMLSCRSQVPGGEPFEERQVDVDAPVPAETRPAGFDPQPGASGVGDPYYPTAGNGGFDVGHYDLDLTLDVERNFLEGVASIQANATQDLSSFHLDLAGFEVRSIDVSGARADFAREEQELVVTPRTPIQSGAAFSVEVAYAGEPHDVPDPAIPVLPGVGWWRTESGLHVIAKFIGARTWFPCNDHPSDKATYSLRVSVPKPYVAASMGLLEEEVDGEGSTTFVWRTIHPLPTYLATLSVAKYARRVEEGPGGIPLRLFYPADSTPEELAPHERYAEIVRALEEHFGPYPLESLGGVILSERLGGALECQTLPIYARGSSLTVVVHQIAHQWFGCSVTAQDWRDHWIDEGYATLAGWLWMAHDRSEREAALLPRQLYQVLRARSLGPPYDPGLSGLYAIDRMRTRSAWVLHALRTELGEEIFYDITRTFLERHRDGNATTADYVALCEEKSGRDLDAFFQAWLLDPVIPRVLEMDGGSLRITRTRDPNAPRGPGAGKRQREQQAGEESEPPSAAPTEAGQEPADDSEPEEPPR
jgi:aminopeptidase N